MTQIRYLCILLNVSNNSSYLSANKNFPHTFITHTVSRMVQNIAINHRVILRKSYKTPAVNSSIQTEITFIFMPVTSKTIHNNKILNASKSSNRV